jgi:hypothetical protein
MCIWCNTTKSGNQSKGSMIIYYIQIYPVSEGYLRKIPVERRGKYPEPLTLTIRIYLFNSAEYLTASKTVACKQVQNFRPPRSFDFLNLRKQEKSFQRSDQCINSGTNSKIKQITFCLNIQHAKKK